jgi:hypothetical protein
MKNCRNTLLWFKEDDDPAYDFNLLFPKLFISKTNIIETN